jgi:S-adenosylmethionine:tRNA ribosyltransferase-isomerase
MSPLDAYDYTLPPELIAHEPAEPREAARLFVYDTATDTVSLHTVADLPGLIPQSLMVVNDTTVVPARVHGTLRERPIELLVLVDQGVGEDGTVSALVNRGVKVGDEIVVPLGIFVVLENHERAMLVRYSGGSAGLSELLCEHGETPLPPYIDSPSPEIIRRAQYQTVFAAADAPSVAAPTASLHFTPQLLERLAAAGTRQATITLQVGLGTFAPVYPEHFARKQLHEEHYFVSAASAQAIRRARIAGIPIVAVGTTVVRTLETAKEAIVAGTGTYGTTDLFIYPPHHFTFPDVLMTNFHVPKSSLMCLVQAFLEHKGARRQLVDLYQDAIEARFRFFSFGDAMLIV